jgi:hypothetical protein
VNPALRHRQAALGELSPWGTDRLGEFRAFVGQDDHLRHDAFAHPSKIS